MNETSPPPYARRTRWRRVRSAAVLALATPGLLLAASGAGANPAGGQVRIGSAAIAGQGTSRVDVHQQTSTAVLSWDSFDIGEGEVTQFHQPGRDAVAINRIFQGDASQILGSLQANGHVYLINPNGILFGHEARVNVHALVATTTFDGSDLAPQGFDPSSQPAPGASVANEGVLQSGPGGFVYLVAPTVRNGRDGVIVSPEGEVRIEAGATVYLTDRADGLGLAVEYTAPTDSPSEAINLGDILADGGLARMRADVVVQGGLVQADSLRESNGVVELVASESLRLEAGSETLARGGAEIGTDGGTVFAWSDRDAVMEEGALVDVSAQAFGGDGGFAELSAAERVDVAGRFQAGGGRGGRPGEILIDPAELEIQGTASFTDAGRVVLEAEEEVRIAEDAVLDLASSDEARLAVAQRTLLLRSGGDVTIGEGAVIRDDGTGPETWNVDIVAGADLGADPEDAHVLAAGSDGDVRVEAAAGILLARGDLQVTGAGDLLLDPGSSLRDVEGDIDVDVGGDVVFQAPRDSFTETVIETGSGDIRVVAGGSVLLQSAPGSGGNAAIRTRGVQSVDANGEVSRSDGGDILVWARSGSVDAGVGNRWVEPGPSLQSGGPEGSQFGIGNVPDFDPIPVVDANNLHANNPGNTGADGILGIGTEAGGSVVVIAAGDVVTDDSPLGRASGTASGLGTTYDGAHIGAFGVPVRYVAIPQLAQQGAVALPGAPQNAVVVIAGGNVTGDYMVRNGTATLLAGYALPAGVDTVAALGPLGLLDAVNLDRAALRRDLSISPQAAAGGLGWVGTNARPLTVDLVDGSADLLGYRGVAVRTVENPSLVYPPSGSGTGTARAPSYGPDDFALLESEVGDVVLIGNEIVIPDAANGGSPRANPLVRVLPPSLVVRTHAAEGERPGDFVVLNDFTLFPSEDGGLELDVAGQVRTAHGAASETAVVSISVETLGGAADLAFEIPAGARLLDPETGLVYTATRVQVAERAPAQPGQVTAIFQAARGFENQEIVIPAGTRAEDWGGRVYVTRNDQILRAPELRLSRGEVRLVPESGVATTPITIPVNTEFVAPDGTVFLTTQGANLQIGDTAVTLPVVAAPGVFGIDAPQNGLQLVTPIAGIVSATNRLPTQRLPEVPVVFFAEAPGQTDPSSYSRLKTLLAPVPGAEIKFGQAPVARGGTDPGVTGRLLNEPTATAPVVGPVGQILEPRELVLLDTGLLPAGVDPDEIRFVATGTQQFAPLVPSILREPGGDGRPDASGTRIDILDPSAVWVRDSSGNVAILKQSDADPGFDARNLGRGFDYVQYYALCRSGTACPGNVSDPLQSQGGVTVPLETGGGPTHAGDATPASLRAGAGFERITFDLAEAAVLRAGPAEGEEFAGGQADLLDVALITQHTRAGDVTRVLVPFGDALFAAEPRQLIDGQTGIPTMALANPLAGITVAGPGALEIEVGVDGGQPTGLGGRLGLSDVAVGNSSARGIETIGNLANAGLPESSAGITILAAGNVELNDRGAIDTLQGGDISITSLGGSVLGGQPDAGFTGKRGIVTLFVPSGATQAATSGGGSISIDAFGDFDIGRSAAATLSGGDIFLRSRTGSISAGSAEPFAVREVTTSQTSSLPEVKYDGGGIFSTDRVVIVAEEDVDIGAGITGAAIAIAAGGNVVAGQGSIMSSGNISIDAGGSISGTISASGSISVSGDVSQSASLSAGGLVAGAGSVASNTGPGKVSAETSVATQASAELASSRASVTSGQNRRGVIIDVSSSPAGASADEEEEDE